MIDDVIKCNKLQAHGIVGFYRANTVDDDVIVLFDQDDNEVARLFGIRQQAAKETHDSSAYMSIADFIAPLQCGYRDYIGLFVVSAGFGCEQMCQSFMAKNDVYGDIMIKAVADRFAEAFAEELHERVRKELWGYQPEETLDTHDLLRVSYEGIRPAPGYPSQPDHTEKATFWKLMDVEKETGIEITDSLAIWPPSSTCGIYFAHPKSKYFAVGKIQKDQAEVYAQRKSLSTEQMERWLAPMLAYDT